MGVPMDCCACWFDDSTYLKEALSLTPTYLRGTGNMLDYKDWQIPLGRCGLLWLKRGTGKALLVHLCMGAGDCHTAVHSFR
jgi:hypothetical protein